jgi:hypothetical protein
MNMHSPKFAASVLLSMAVVVAIFGGYGFQTLVDYNTQLKNKPEVSVIGAPYGGVCNGTSDDQPAFVAAIAANPNKTIGMRSACYIGSNLTFPANVGLSMYQGGSFVLGSGVVLTIQSPFDPGLLHVFRGSGTVSFTGNTALKEVPPEWWGALADNGTTDNSVFLQSAATAAAGRTLRLRGPGYYQIASATALSANTTVACEGAAQISNVTSGSKIFTIDSVSNVRIQGCHLTLNRNYSTTSDDWGVPVALYSNTANTSNIWIEKDVFDGYTSGGVVFYSNTNGTYTISNVWVQNDAFINPPDTTTSTAGGGSADIWLQGNVRQIWIQNNVGMGTNDYGVAGDVIAATAGNSMDGIFLSRNFWWNKNVEGELFYETHTGASSNQVTNVKIDHEDIRHIRTRNFGTGFESGRGIYIQGVLHSDVTNCFLFDTLNNNSGASLPRAALAFNLPAGDTFTAVNNTIDTTVFDGIQVVGSIVTSGTYVDLAGSTISGNVSRNYANAGVHVWNASNVALGPNSAFGGVYGAYVQESNSVNLVGGHYHGAIIGVASVNSPNVSLNGVDASFNNANGFSATTDTGSSISGLQITGGTFNNNSQSPTNVNAGINIAPATGTTYTNIVISGVQSSDTQSAHTQKYGLFANPGVRSLTIGYNGFVGNINAPSVLAADTTYTNAYLQTGYTSVATVSPAQLAAGFTFFPGLPSHTMAVSGLNMQVSGTFATCTDVRVSSTDATPSDIAIVAVGDLTTGAKYGLSSSQLQLTSTWNGGQTLGSGLQIRSTGSTCTGGASVAVQVQYYLN